jgi:Fe-S-cluster-containing hydrogenase component 2
MAYQINEELCTFCGDCEPVCPTSSIAPASGVYAINATTCNECDGESSELPHCVETCLQDDCIVPA